MHSILDQRFQRCTIPWQRLGDGVLVLGTTTSEVHELNETAGLLWEWLATPSTAAELGQRLAAEYDVSTEVASLDAANVLVDWSSKHLVEPA